MVEYDAKTMTYFFKYEIFPGEEYHFEVRDRASAIFDIDRQISEMLHAQKIRAIEDSKI